MGKFKGTYEIEGKSCKQKEHVKVNLIEHNNVMYCTKCNQVLIADGRAISYDGYFKWMYSLEKYGYQLYYTATEIDAWAKANNYK